MPFYRCSPWITKFRISGNPRPVEMKRLSGWFRSNKSASDRSPPVDEAVLDALEAKAQAARSGFRWIPLNRAGDLCDRAGDRARALGYYGRAIDAMLEDGQPEPARGLATKIVRIHPEAVRTLCTLTWLELASHHMASGVMYLKDYVEAARKAGRQDLAGEQIYLMARITADAEFRGAAADALDALECADNATAVRDWIASGHAPQDVEDTENWTDLCLGHAVGSNAQSVTRPPRGVVHEGMTDHGEAEDAGTAEVQETDTG